MSARVWHMSLGGVLLTAGGFIENAVAADPTAVSNPNSVLANPTPAQPVSTEWQQEQPDEMNVFQPVGGTAANPVPQIFRYGPVTLLPHANYRFAYGNGIQSTPGLQQSSIIQEISPGILMNLGQHWSLDYTPSLDFYSDSHFQDVVNHSVTLTGNVLYEAWIFGLAHNSQIVSSPTVATGAQTDQSTHSTTLTASHSLTSKTSVDLDLGQAITLVSGFEDSYDWHTLDWLNYQFWPRFSAGIGVGGGYVLVNDNSGTAGGRDLDQTYEQAQARINWRATDKISFQISGGLEDRQFKTPGTGDSLNPLFGAVIQYLPFKNTQVALSANRSVSSSDYYVISQQAETTVVGLSVDQRLFKEFSLDLGVTYAQVDYSTSIGPISIAAVDRTDKDVSFNARLSHSFFKRGTWSIFYSYADNRSSQPGYSFASNQTGFEIGYKF